MFLLKPKGAEENMLGDSLYLDNIEEYVRDESRIVTYKWLSRTLSVPVNAAKRMLYEYVDKNRSSKCDPISVIYMVSGLKDSRDGPQQQEILLVEEKDLEGVKNGFSTLWNVHVYSVQKTTPTESEVLYNADHHSNKEYLSCYQQWNTISCPMQDRAATRTANVHANRNSPETSPPTAAVTLPQEKKKVESKASRQIFPRSKSAKKEPASKRAMVSFFSKTKTPSSCLGSSESTSTPPKPSPIVSAEQEVTVSQRASSSKQAQPIAKQSPLKCVKSDKSPSKSIFKLFKGLHDSDVEDDEKGETDLDFVQTNKKQKKDEPKRMMRESGETKQQQIKKESNSGSQLKKHLMKKKGPGRKRRRVQCMSSDESDSEEDMKSVEESSTGSLQVPGEESGKRRKRVRRLITKTCMDEDGSMVTEKQWEDVSTDASSDGEKEGRKRRKRVRRLITKTYMDEDDSMVTEKQWEDVSTDASSDGEKDVGAATTHSSSSATTAVSLGGMTTSHYSPSKSTKQSSLMNFFGK